MDPAQREKDDCRTWLHETIEKLQQQNEQFEATIDQVNSGKKKKLSRADQGKFRSNLYKEGCVFPMAIWSEFRYHFMGRYRDDHNREGATHVISIRQLGFTD